MKISDKTLQLIEKEYPHSLDIVKAFKPLLEAKAQLVQDLPPCDIPPLNPERQKEGKTWLDPSIHVDVFLDKAFLHGAPAPLAQAIMAGFPAVAEEVAKIQDILEGDELACRSLAASGLEGAKTERWAKKYGLNEEVVHFFGTHLGGAAGERVAHHAAKIAVFTALDNKEVWDYGYCPLCGGPAHLSLVRGKDGQRFLQCSVCRTEWIYSRTACPSCKEDALKKLQYFFIEKNEQDRAQACESCKGYILEKDLRNDAGEVPLDVYLLCMGPLDVLMQEKGYSPIFEK